MTALVLSFPRTCRNAVETARQDYELAKAHFLEVCDRFDATSEDGVRRFHSALERRQEAFERYMVELHG